MKDKELDDLIRNALLSKSSFNIPEGLAEKTLQALEKRLLLRQLFIELFSKIGLVTLCLAIFAGVLIWSKGTKFLSVYLDTFSQYADLIWMAGIIGMVVILIDQIVLKFYQIRKNFLENHI